MPLKVAVAPSVAADTAFTLIVPAQETWHMLTVAATLSRAVGGTPNRSMRLTITDGTNTLLSSPCDDAGTEPGTCTCTWANATPATSSSGTTGTSLGPLPNMMLLPGYTITGTVLNGAAADQWTRAVAWVDYTPT